MTRTRVGTTLVALIGAGISYIGARYLAAPAATVPSYAGTPEPDPVRLLGNAKGVRDLTTGIAIATLLLTGRRRAAGWFTLGGALIPLGDMAVVLANHGSRATALGVHGGTAVAALAGGALLVRRD